MNLHSLLKTVFYKAGYSIKKIRKTSPMAASSKAGAAADSPKGMRWLDLLHARNPYQDFHFESITFDAHGWGGDSAAFKELITRIRPKTIVEVGTWKGASALTMAQATKELGLDAQILCVDTWLGALEFWTQHDDPERYKALKLINGYPSVYYQFLANVCHQGFQDRIVPFSQTASTAALWLRYWGLTADLIYIDASHEEEDVHQDLCSYWDLVSPGGILFGDDYSWDGVRLAVERFAREIGQKVTFCADKWLMERAR